MRPEEVPQPLHHRHRLLHLLHPERQRLPIVPRHQEHHHRLAPIPLQRLRKLKDVPLGFRHLLVPGPHHPVVHPDPRERLPVRLRLRDLVLVMGEHQIRATPVDGELGPQLLLGHHRALDVPGRPPRAPGGLPARVLAFLGRLPEGEVEAALLQQRRARLLALVHLLGVAVGELAVAVEAADAEVDVAASLVGVAALDQVGDHRDDPVDRLGRQRLGVRAAEAEGAGVFEVGAGHLRRPLGRGHAPLAGGGVDLVVDVGDVDDQLRRVALRLEEAGEQREDDEGAGVADVDAAVDGRPAGVDADDGVERLERPLLAAQGVPDPHLAHRGEIR